MAIHIRRREFITALGRAAATWLLGSAAVAWPMAAHAQPSKKLPTIGFLGAATSSTWKDWVSAFVQRLRELGWIEGHTVAIEYRWAEGREERFDEIAAEFVTLNVDVIVTAGTAPVIAAMRATSTIPIVFATAGNPLDTGLVMSLARPGGNVTGLSNQAFDIAAKRLEILSEAVFLRRLAILANTGSPLGVLEMREAEAAGRQLGFEVVRLEIRRAEDIVSVFATLKGRADAIYVVHEPLVSTYRVQINGLALDARLPTMHDVREGVEAGGLISYGPNFPRQYRRAADMSTKFCGGRSRATSPSSSRPSSTWSSI
jgi:putative tryptophan/tyrosine transport system substrate-binding protein